MNLMKIAFVSLVSLSALADQTINCYEINKSGTRKAKGITLRVELNGTGNKVTLKGAWKKGSSLGKEFEYISADQSDEGVENRWTHVYFNDAHDGGMVEYQLQFEEALLNQKFSKKKATLAIGVENNSSEAYPSWGYDLECSGRVN